MPTTRSIAHWPDTIFTGRDEFTELRKYGCVDASRISADRGTDGACLEVELCADLDDASCEAAGKAVIDLSEGIRVITCQPNSGRVWVVVLGQVEEVGAEL